METLMTIINASPASSTADLIQSDSQEVSAATYARWIYFHVAADPLGTAIPVTESAGVAMFTPACPPGRARIRSDPRQLERQGI